MGLDKSLNIIKNTIKEKYEDNLAGILVLGSANTGHYVEGVSDINTMIFVKQQNKLDFQKEIKDLTTKLKTQKFQSQYFNSLEGIKDYLQKRKSFATYLVMTADDGATKLYTTPEFKSLKKSLRENPFSKEEIKNHVEEKDKFEIGEKRYMREESEEQFRERPYRATQNFLFHLRRKAQIINYLKTEKLIFDFSKCLENADLPSNDKAKLYELYDLYEKREKLSSDQIDFYFDLANKLTAKIKEI